MNEAGSAPGQMVSNGAIRILAASRMQPIERSAQDTLPAGKEQVGGFCHERVNVGLGHGVERRVRLEKH